MIGPTPVSGPSGVYAVVRNATTGIMVVVHGQADLLEIVLRTGTGGRFPYFLDSGQQQAD